MLWIIKRKFGELNIKTTIKYSQLIFIFDITGSKEAKIIEINKLKLLILNDSFVLAKYLGAEVPKNRRKDISTWCLKPAWQRRRSEWGKLLIIDYKSFKEVGSHSSWGPQSNVHNWRLSRYAHIFIDYVNLIIWFSVLNLILQPSIKILSEIRWQHQIFSKLYFIRSQNWSQTQLTMI